MKLIFSIEYKTAWGEEVVLCLDGKRIGLEYVADGLWQGEVSHTALKESLEYGYEIVREGVPCARSGEDMCFRKDCLPRPSMSMTVGRTVRPTLHSILLHSQRESSEEVNRKVPARARESALQSMLRW